MINIILSGLKYVCVLLLAIIAHEYGHATYLDVRKIPYELTRHGINIRVYFDGNNLSDAEKMSMTIRGIIYGLGVIFLFLITTFDPMYIVLSWVYVMGCKTDLLLIQKYRKRSVGKDGIVG